MDGFVGVQFLWFGEGEGLSKVVVVEENQGAKRRWRRASGWMRGWMPSGSFSKTRPGQEPPAKRVGSGEREGLLASAVEGEEGYGGVK